MCIETGTDFRNLEGTTNTTISINSLSFRPQREIIINSSNNTQMHAETNAVTHMYTYQWRIEYRVNYSLKGSEDTKA